MELYRLPGLLQPEGDLKTNWKRFRQEFDIYMTASEKNQKSSEIQAALLLNMIGEYGRQLFNDFEMNDTDKKDIDKILAKFEKICVPEKNIVMERLKFNRRCQQKGETFDQFLESIQNLILSCEYGNDEDNILRDRILAGISKPSLTEELIAREDVWDVKTAITLCRARAADVSDAERNVQGNGTYILAVYVRRMDYVMANVHGDQYANGYSVYSTLHDRFKSMDTKKFLGIWRREACGSCNLMNCNCKFRWFHFMTTVIALCEETAETLELLAAQVAGGYHSLKIDRFDDLRNGDLIAEKIKLYGVNQKLTRNAEDWNSQCTKLEMVDAEYGGTVSSRDEKPPTLPPALP
ncbi:hypothetical protein HA402_004839 [Bradysia odoriphaga]|nr:hypothetical protein HA402_004839 [Bradysia odoriphaga]